jgi:hypothetical protein
MCPYLNQKVSYSTSPPLLRYPMIPIKSKLHWNSLFEVESFPDSRYEDKESGTSVITQISTIALRFRMSFTELRRGRLAACPRRAGGVPTATVKWKYTSRGLTTSVSTRRNFLCVSIVIIFVQTSPYLCPSETRYQTALCSCLHLAISAIEVRLSNVGQK